MRIRNIKKFEGRGLEYIKVDSSITETEYMTSLEFVNEDSYKRKDANEFPKMTMGEWYINIITEQSKVVKQIRRTFASACGKEICFTYPLSGIDINAIYGAYNTIKKKYPSVKLAKPSDTCSLWTIEKMYEECIGAESQSFRDFYDEYNNIFFLIVEY